MPRITVPLCVNYDAISRPVAHQIARDVMTICNIPEGTPLYLPGEFEVVNQPGSAMGESGNEAIRFESYRRAFVVMEEKLRDSSVMQQIVMQNEMPPMLEDRRLGISIRPVYMQSDMSLSFRYTASTRQEAIKWRDEFANKRAQNRTAIQHEISYDIPVQEGVLKLLATLWGLREKVAGYGESFVEWFKSMQTRPFGSVGTQDGEIAKTTITVPEKQAQLTGWFDFEDIPVERKVEGNSVWDIEFTYKTMYHRCTHLYIVYPMMIHQSRIPKAYYDTRPRFSVEELTKNGPIGIKALDVMDGNVDSLPPPQDGLRVPYYDEWIANPKAQPPYTIPAISWMIQLDPTDPQDILNLRQIPGMRFTLEMDRYLSEQHQGLTRSGGAVCQFTLYVDDTAMSPSILTIDQDLNVRATKPLDLRKSYHLRLSFGNRYSMFSRDAFRAMEASPIATLQAFQSILPRLDVEFALEQLIEGKYLPHWYIQWFYRYLADHQSDTGGPINTGDGSSGGLGPWRPSDPGGSSGSNWNNDGRNREEVSPPWRAVGMSGGRYVQFLAIMAKRDATA